MTDQANDHTLKDIEKVARALGQAKGKGDRSLSALALKVCELAHEYALGLPDKKKKGEPDDAERIWNAFADGRAKAQADAGLDYAPIKSPVAQISKIRKVIRLGRMAKPVDGPKLLAAAIERIRAFQNAGNPLPAAIYECLLMVASEQLRRGVAAEKGGDPLTMMTDDDIDAVLSPEASEPSLEKKWASLLKSATSLQTGSDDLPPDESGELVQIIKQAKARIAALQYQTELAEKASIIAAMSPEMREQILAAFTIKPGNTADLPDYDAQDNANVIDGECHETAPVLAIDGPAMGE